MVFNKQKNANSGFVGHSMTTNLNPYKVNRNKKKVNKSKKNRDAERKRMNFRICQKLFQSESYDNLYIFSEDIIKDMQTSNCLRIINPGMFQKYFLNVYPIKRPFLISDGKKIKGWAEFKSEVYIYGSVYSRKLIIKEFKDGCYFKSLTFCNGFSAKYKPDDMDIFLSYFK